MFGRVDFAKFGIGASTLRNCIVKYQGGASSRAGTAFVGYSKQTTLQFSTGTITFSVNPVNGDTITLNSVTWTFVTSGAFGNQTNIQGTLAFTLTTLAGQLNASIDPHLNVASYTFNATQLIITYKTNGSGGNSYTLAASSAAVSAATLLGGDNSPPRLITFQFNLNQGLVLEFGQFYMRVISNGAFVTETGDGSSMAPLTITGITNANPAVVTVASGGSALLSGDWVFLNGIGGMVQLNGRTVVAVKTGANTFFLQDVFGNGIDSTAFGTYTSGGTVARIFTLMTPWAATDLIYLKTTQSADVMSICCRNQVTGASYSPYDLARITDDDWTLTVLATGSSIAAPTGLSGIATITTMSNPTDYQYVVTQVDAVTGDESIASILADIPDSVDISSTAGSEVLSWVVSPDASYSNIYKAPPAYSASVPIGSLFGFAGSVIAPGNSFVDSNILEDLTQVPPTHQNPFGGGAATGTITFVSNPTVGDNITLNGLVWTFVASGATGNETNIQASLALTLEFLVSVVSPNLNVSTDPRLTVASYTSSTTVLTITYKTSGAGGNSYTLAASAATPSGAHLTGGAPGNNPSVPAYFQERRVYANTATQPDTYWMSQPGAFTNFDSRIPTIDDDSIVGTPWSVQVDGIQFMEPLLSSLVVLTGQGAYLLGGIGTSPTAPQPITPSSQQALPQAFNGCNSFVAPVRIDYDIYYLQSKGSIIRNLSFNFWINVMTGVDITYLSSHLFTGFQVMAMSWCEEPYKIMWAVRDDGVLLSLTSLKSEDIMGWGRHDTQGLFVACTSVTEPPVDALYVATQRFFPNGNTPFMIERMDNRIWAAVEDCWCVDAGLQLPQSTPNATLQITGNPNGQGEPVGINIANGGVGYSQSTSASLVDPTGTGCTIVPIINTNGTITGFNISGGTNYTDPQIQISDPNSTSGGSGFSGTVTLENFIAIATNAPVLSGTSGMVIRAGGGVFQITTVVGSELANAEVVSPIVGLIPGTALTLPFQPGTWTLSNPVTTITGLDHLDGLAVTGLADGNPIPPTMVVAGSITLAHAASAVTAGLPFQAQVQSLYMTGGNPTDQGRRKQIAAVTVRLEASGSCQVGTNQPDGSVQSPATIQPTWTELATANTDQPGLTQPAYGSGTVINLANVVRPVPLYTGDIRVPTTAGFEKQGQVAVQQLLPLPLNVLAFIREVALGDDPEDEPKPRQASNG